MNLFDVNMADNETLHQEGAQAEPEIEVTKEETEMADFEITTAKEETEMTDYEMSKTADKKDRLYFEDLKTAEDVKAYNAQKELREIKYDGEGEYLVNTVYVIDGKVNVQKDVMKFENEQEIGGYADWLCWNNKNANDNNLLMLYRKVDDSMDLDEPLNEKDPKVNTYIADKKAVSNYIRAKASKEKKEANKMGRKKKEKYVYVPNESQMRALQRRGITGPLSAPTRKRRKKAEQAAEPAEVKVVDQTEEVIEQVAEPVEQAEDMRI